MPPATNCTSCLAMARSSLSPPLSMNVTSLRSSTHFRPLPVRCVFLQLVLSSRTHGPTKRPCRIHFSSAGVSVLVIFNTSTSLARRIDSFTCRQRGRNAQRCLSYLDKLFRWSWHSMVGASAPSACELRCHRIQTRLRPWRLSSARCHLCSRRRRYRESWDSLPRSGQILVLGP